MRATLNRVVALAVLLAVASCGGKQESSEEEPATAPKASGADGREAGENLAKEVIDTFDQIVAQVAKALESKPEKDEAMTRLEAIYDEWLPKMEAFAATRKTFTDPPVRGAFNAYMGEHRGKAMFRKDNALGGAFMHYQNMKRTPEVIEFLNKQLVELIEIAHNR